MTNTGNTQRPWWAMAAPYAAAGGGLAYGALRTYWAMGHRPDFPPAGDDLGVMSGWGAVGLCAAAVVLAPLVTAVPRAWFPRTRHPAHPPRRTRVAWQLCWIAAVTVAGALALSSFMIVLDIVALLFPGIGIPSSPAALAGRAACLALGVALGLTALAARRTARDACPYCGRRHDAPHPDGAAPRWAMMAAYAAVAGCLVRLVSQVAIGFGTAPIGHGSLGAAIAALAFTVCMLLAGTLLPLALVHRWGRVFPRWTLPLAGRRVPRPLLAIPACFVAGGLLAYFGVGLGQMVVAAVTGAPLFAPGVPAAFVWTAVPAYLVWGAGLAVATASYLARTRPGCARCGRGAPVDTASRTLRAALL